MDHDDKVSSASSTKPNMIHIAELPKSQEPLNRILRQGPHALSNTELLALLLQGTSRTRNPLDLSAQALGKARSLRLVSSMTAREMATQLDLPDRGAARIAAAMELSRRVSEEAIPMGQSITGAEDAFAFLRPRLTDPSREVFGMIFLTQRHAVIAWEVLFQGTLTMANVHPREVLKAVLRHGAAAVVAAHTHCSGHVSPSPDDVRLTEELKTLLKHVDCRLLDHLVLSGPSYFSFAREGLLT